MNEWLRVIILNYNQPKITVECTVSVLKQSYSSMDIVVVDNGSTKNNYIRLMELLPSNVELVRSEHNLGYAAGNNLGARWPGHLSKPDFFLILNNDAFFEDKDAIKKLLFALKKDQNRVVVSPLVNIVSDDCDPKAHFQARRDTDFAACVISGSWWLSRLPYLKKIYDWHIYADWLPYKENREYNCDSVNGCCFMIKANFLKSIGYFDEGTFLYFEELVLGRQVKLSGRYCCLLTSVTVDHYEGFTTGQRETQVRFKMHKEYIKSQVYYCKKYLRAGKLKIGLLVTVRIIDFVTKYPLQKLLKLLKLWDK